MHSQGYCAWCLSRRDRELAGFNQDKQNFYYFSGIIFSTLLAGAKQISSVMAINLLGAICGGLLEYNSMYFGFRALYLMAMACYVLAFASEHAFRRRTVTA